MREVDPADFFLAPSSPSIIYPIHNIPANVYFPISYNNQPEILQDNILQFNRIISDSVLNK